MEKTVGALEKLYEALGGAAADMENCRTNVDVLNAISAKYGGASDAILNAEAIENIAAVADKIGGGGKTRVQVIHGTVNDPWNGQDWLEMWKALNSKTDATGMVTIGNPSGPVSFQAFLFATGNPDIGKYYIEANAAHIGETLDASYGGSVVWEIHADWNQETKAFEVVDILLDHAAAMQNGNVVDYTATVELLDLILNEPVTTTIIYHPLPEGQEG